MASIQLATFDGQMQPPATHTTIHTPSSESPRVQRPSSQASLHLPPASFSPLSQDGTATQNSPFMSNYSGPHPQPGLRMPPHLALPVPNAPSFYSTYPTTAPPLGSYDASPVFDTRGSMPMVRSFSHAHGIHSATEHTASSRYSNSPHSAHTGGAFDTRTGPPPTATTTPGAYAMHNPSISVTHDDFVDSKRHIDTSLLTSNGYGMARSVSGGSSDMDADGRLVTPHYDYRGHGGDFAPSGDQEMRKVSGGGRAMPHFYATHGGNHDLNGSVGIGAHPQPEGLYYTHAPGRMYQPDHFAISSERGDMKTEMGAFGVSDTDYERERQANILQNRKVMTDLGLDHGQPRSRASSHSVRTGKHKKRRQDDQVRISTRIASQGRNVSYTELDGQRSASGSLSDGEDEYSSPEGEEDEDEFRPTKKSKGAKRAFSGHHGGGGGSKPKGHGKSPKPLLSLYGLLEVYSQIPHSYPLFYFTLNNDLTINSDSVPLIGSIPSTYTPIEKADTLQAYFHRGRRVLAQLDAFTQRCDRKYEGPEDRLPELEYHTRIAVRDVRRKIVERCENYKYTRRDILDKVLGKNKWQPIENGMIEWRAGSGINDPAGDLANVTLTQPTPPPGHRGSGSTAGQIIATYPPRVIRSFPSRANLAVPTSARSVSITMASPSDPYANPTPHAVVYGYPHQDAPPPMYGENEVPMTVQMPGGSGAPVSAASASVLTPTSTSSALPHTAQGSQLGVAGMAVDVNQSAAGSSASQGQHSASVPPQGFVIPGSQGSATEELGVGMGTERQKRARTDGSDEVGDMWPPAV